MRFDWLRAWTNQKTKKSHFEYLLVPGKQIIGVPNMDMPHDWLLALESEIEVLTNQN